MRKLSVPIFCNKTSLILNDSFVSAVHLLEMRFKFIQILKCTFAIVEILNFATQILIFTKIEFNQSILSSLGLHPNHSRKIIW